MYWCDITRSFSHTQVVVTALLSFANFGRRARAERERNGSDAFVWPTLLKCGWISCVCVCVRARARVRDRFFPLFRRDELFCDSRGPTRTWDGVVKSRGPRECVGPIVVTPRTRLNQHSLRYATGVLSGAAPMIDKTRQLSVDREWSRRLSRREDDRWSSNARAHGDRRSLSLQKRYLIQASRMTRAALSILSRRGQVRPEHLRTRRDGDERCALRTPTQRLSHSIHGAHVCISEEGGRADKHTSRKKTGYIYIYLSPLI